MTKDIYVKPEIRVKELDIEDLMLGTESKAGEVGPGVSGKEGTGPDGAKFHFLDNTESSSSINWDD